METTRKDGRKPNQIRPFSMEQSLLNRADGSVRFVQGTTQVLAAAYGPMEVKARREVLDRATVEVAVTPETGPSGPREIELEETIRRTVEAVVLTSLHPRTLIRITVQIVNDSGSLLACCLHAVFMALVDAGIPVGSLCACGTAAVLPTGVVVLDPDLAEEQAAVGVVECAVEGSSKSIDTASASILVLFSTGALARPVLRQCIDAAVANASQSLAFMSKALQRKVAASANVLGLPS